MWICQKKHIDFRKSAETLYGFVKFAYKYFWGCMRICQKVHATNYFKMFTLAEFSKKRCTQKHLNYTLANFVAKQFNLYNKS